jgi:hypothetical protein
MSGRTLVWHEPKPATPPYALTGAERDAKREQAPRLEFRPQGRAGTSVEATPERDAR